MCNQSLCPANSHYAITLQTVCMYGSSCMLVKFDLSVFCYHMFEKLLGFGMHTVTEGMTHAEIMAAAAAVASSSSGSQTANTEKSRQKRRRRGSVMEAKADRGGGATSTAHAEVPAVEAPDTKPRTRRRRGSVEEDRHSHSHISHDRAGGGKHGKNKPSKDEGIVPQHNDGMLKQVKTKQSRARRGSVSEVKVDLIALQKEEEAKVGGQRKQDSAVMQRRRRRASINENG